MKIDWKSLKKFLDDTQLVKFINYIELDTSYYVWIYYEGESFSSILDKGTVDCQVFISDYKPYAVLKNDLDEDGIKMSKTIFVGRSRMMHCLFTCITTSSTQTNDETGFITVVLKDAQHQIVQESSQAVYTEASFCPHPTDGYGLYGGAIEAIEDIDTDIIASAILAPDFPPSMGGQIYYIRNRLLNKPRENLSRHAINVGDVPGGVVGANVLRIQLKHDMGIQKRFQIEIQYYI
jgi:hypothetical protein